MTNLSRLICATSVAIILSSGVAMAGSHLGGAVKARQALMQLRLFNLIQLGNMAKGKVDYDADAAVAAAGNLQMVTAYNMSAIWPQESSTAELGEATRALPEIWSTFPAIIEKNDNLVAAVEILVAKAGTLEGLQGAIGAVGKACGSCHGDFRQKKE